MSRYFFPFAGELISGHIVRRYKRFLADVILADGQMAVAHVPNSGSMSTCWHEGAAVILTRHAAGGSRKLNLTLQAVQMPDAWVSVNTMNPNAAVAGAIQAGAIDVFAGYECLQREVKCAVGSRFDLCLFDLPIDREVSLLSLKPEKAIRLPRSSSISGRAKPPAVIEIKNVTLLSRNGVLFPDAVTERGLKHLHHLVELKKAGLRAVLVFFAGRSGAEWVGPASDIDPQYSQALSMAIKSGVEVVALKIDVSASGLAIDGALPLRL